MKAEEMITERQIKKIWYEASRLSLSSEAIHDLIKIYDGKTSLKQLTKSEAIEFIDVLTEEGPGGTGRDGMATSRQIWKINELKNQLGWSDKGLNTFINRCAHVDNIHWLDTQAASNIINGLINIIEQNSKKAAEN